MPPKLATTVGIAVATTVDSIAARKMDSMIPAKTHRFRASSFMGSPRAWGPSPRPGRLLQAHPSEEIVHCEVLVLAPRVRPPADRLLAQRPPTTIVMVEGFADGEIAGRADFAPAEAAGEEPVGGPSAEPAQRREPLDHRRRGLRADRLEIQGARDDGAGEVTDVLGLARPIFERPQLAQARPGEPP